MAIINKTDITDGGTIQAEHITRAIDALSGGSSDTVIATGSFSGSFRGDGSQLSGVSSGFPYTGSAQITGSLGVTGSVLVSNGTSVVLDTSAQQLYDSSQLSSIAWNIRQLDDNSELPAVNWNSRELYDAGGNSVLDWENRLFSGTASFATTASYALNAAGGSGAGFPFTGSAIISGSLIVTGSTNISSSLTANDITTNNSLTVTGIADFNDAVNINTNPLTVNTDTYISARTNIVELDNTSTFSESVTDYAAGTTFFVNMTGPATASFFFEPLNPSTIGTSYKILITKYTAGQIELKNSAGDTVFFGHYIDISKPDSFASARSVKITSAEATCIEAYFINGNNNDEWFFDISTAGNLNTT
jgi:hypothetical protein